MSVKLSSNWQRFRNMLSGFTESVVRSVRPATWQAAADLRDDFHRRIRSNPPPPLKEATVQRKKYKGSPFFSQTWIESEWLVENLLVDVPVIQMTSEMVTVGFELSRQTHPSGLPAADIFKMLELGTSHQIARPVLGPLLREAASGRHPALAKFKRVTIDRISKEWAF